MTINEYVENFNFKTKPYKHQIDFMKYGLSHPKFLCLDTMGLGKTLESINLAVACKDLFNYKHCLVICCVSSLRFNWVKEIKTHSYEEPYILGQRINKKGEIQIGTINDRIRDLEELRNNDTLPYFLIINIETIRDKTFCEILREHLKHHLIDMMIVDEIHKCCNPNSKQGKNFLSLQAETMIGMTGTPILNTPLDCYVPLRWLGAEEHNFYQFKNHHCYFGNFKEIIGYKHIDQIKSKMDKISLRRTREEVLDLPPKIHADELVEMTENQKKIYHDVKQAILSEMIDIEIMNNPLSKLTRLRQTTSCPYPLISASINESAKLDRVEELMEEINGKVIIFSSFKETCNETYSRLKKYNPAIYTGDTKNAEKELEKFHNDKTCKVIIGTISKMGTGLTLTEANTVIFIDEPRTKALKDQAEDRAYRIGTTKSVNIITLLCVNTIDEKIHQLVETKGQIADFMIDNKEPKKQLRLFKELMGID